MTDAKFLIHRQTHMFMTDAIHFQITQMTDSNLVWVGRSAGKLGQMSVAVPSRNETLPSATTILGSDVMEQSRNLARRLALKHKEQFFVSLDLASQDELLLVFVEKKLQEMIKVAMT
ncbi:hypothetical protein DM01DRAFT_1328822 [Hesseltinella vesiculosa]|uniref:Proteasome assembly chaperone 3 n=1 Tax=Hesseltinella vesiculosa TaxID=101127 RepID=A0A1X2G4M0_9FUNG|nr:hypothetical protein DM01DRAFT_1328822 [Hesseltinella vesiculosa]